jgi:hypothetical protein
VIRRGAFTFGGRVGDDTAPVLVIIIGRGSAAHCRVPGPFVGDIL